MSDIVTVGLAQMDDAGLQAVNDHIDAGGRICLTGDFFDSGGLGAG